MVRFLPAAVKATNDLLTNVNPGKSDGKSQQLPCRRGAAGRAASAVATRGLGGCGGRPLCQGMRGGHTLGADCRVCCSRGHVSCQGATRTGGLQGLAVHAAPMGASRRAPLPSPLPLRTPRSKTPPKSLPTPRRRGVRQAFDDAPPEGPIRGADAYEAGAGMVLAEGAQAAQFGGPEDCAVLDFGCLGPARLWWPDAHAEPRRLRRGGLQGRGVCGGVAYGRRRRARCVGMDGGHVRGGMRSQGALRRRWWARGRSAAPVVRRQKR